MPAFVIVLSERVLTGRNTHTEDYLNNQLIVGKNISNDEKVHLIVAELSHSAKEPF
jgi:hypothetical protein